MGKAFFRILLFKIKNNFRFGGFPELEDFEKLNIDYTNLNEIIKNWKTLQEVRNLDSRTNILKPIMLYVPLVIILLLIKQAH